MAKPLPRRTKVFYGLGAFGYGTTTQTYSTFLMFFGTAFLGISGALMGLAIAISTIWDAITDPFVGHFSDKTRSKHFGKRHGFMLFGCIAVALTNILIWSISPDLSMWSKFGILFVLLVIIETFNSIYSTPYQALGLDLSKNYEDRTAIQAYKTVFSFLALVVPSLLMSVFLATGHANFALNGFVRMALVTSFLCVGCGFIAILGTRQRHNKQHPEYGQKDYGLPVAPTRDELSKLTCIISQAKYDTYTKNNATARETSLSIQQDTSCGKQSLDIKDNSTCSHGKRVKGATGSRPHKEKKPSVFIDFFSIVKQKNVGRLIAGYAISLMAGAFLTSLGLHIFTYTFHFSTLQIPFIMIALIAGIIIGQPLWFFIAKRTDKIVALKSALFIIIFGMIIFGFVLAFRNQVQTFAVLPLVILTIFFCGVGTGCLYSLPISMFADCIELERQKTGRDKTAMSAAFLTFCTKISNALILFVIGVSLDIIGFRGNVVTQSITVQNWLGWLLIAGVTISAMVAFVIYSGYSYTKKDFEEQASILE